MAALLSVASAHAADLRADQEAWTRQAVVIRDGTSASSRLKGRLEAGTPVRLIDESKNAYGRWWEIRVGTAQGWVLEKFLTADKPAVVIEAAVVPVGGLPPEAVLPAAPVFTPPAEGEDRIAELAAMYKTIRTGTVEERQVVCASLPFSGHTDAQFFDLLNAWLDWKAREAARNDEDVDADVTKCLQGLASSGNPRYADTLRAWSKSSHLSHPGRKVAVRSLQLLADSAMFNHLMNRADTHVEGHSWATTRVINMIRTGDTQLQREAMRRMAKDRKAHAPAFDVLHEQLQKESANLNLDDGLRIDIVSWSCKTLALTHDRKYLPTIRKIAVDYKDNFRLQRNCEGSIENLLDTSSETEVATDASAAEESR